MAKGVSPYLPESEVSKGLAFTPVTVKPQEVRKGAPPPSMTGRLVNKSREVTGPHHPRRKEKGSHRLGWVRSVCSFFHLDRHPLRPYWVLEMRFGNNLPCSDCAHSLMHSQGSHLENEDHISLQNCKKRMGCADGTQQSCSLDVLLFRRHYIMDQVPKTQRSVVLWCPGWPSLGEGQTIAASFYIETLSSDLAKDIKSNGPQSGAVQVCWGIMGVPFTTFCCCHMARQDVPWAPIVQYSRSPGA